MAINLDAIISSAGATSAQQRQQTEQMASLQMQQGKMGGQIASNIRTEGDLRMGAELMEQQALLLARNNARAHATAMGMNGVDASEIITGLRRQMRTDAVAYQAASQKVQNIESNSNLLSNPLGWVTDLLHGDQARADLENIEQRHDTTARQLSNMHSLTQTNVQTQMAIAETADADTIRDIAQANRLLAENNATKAEIDSMSYTVEGINTLRQFGSEEFNRQLQLYNAVTQEARHQQQMAAQQQNLELQKRRMEMDEAELDSWEHTVENVNIARRNQGLEPLPAAVIRRDYGSNTAQGQSMRENELLGQASRNRRSAVYGLSPGHAIQLAVRNGGTLPDTLDDDLADNLTTAYKEVTTAAQQAASNPNYMGELGINSDNYNDPSAIIDATNQRFKSLQEETDRNFGSRAIPLASVTQEFPELAETEVYQRVIAPALEAGTEHLTPAEITTRTASLYANGDISEPEAVAGVTGFAKASLDLYNATSGRTSIGAQVPLEYNVDVMTGSKRRRVDPGTFLLSPIYGVFKGLKGTEEYEQISVINPTDVSHYLQRFRSNAVARQMQQNSSNATP